MGKIDSSLSVTLQLKQAEHELRCRLESILAIHHITFEQWQVLAALLQRPGLRMTELAEEAVLPPASLTRHVDHLVGRALVIRRIDADDRRRAVVALSTRGAELAGQIREVEADASDPSASVTAPA